MHCTVEMRTCSHLPKRPNLCARKYAYLDIKLSPPKNSFPRITTIYAGSENCHSSDLKSNHTKIFREHPGDIVSMHR